MKRLRRILFNTLTAMSLLLAIATAGLWVRSINDPVTGYTTVSAWNHVLTIDIYCGIGRVEIFEADNPPVILPSWVTDTFIGRSWPQGSGFDAWYRPKREWLQNRGPITSQPIFWQSVFSAGVEFPLWFPLGVAMGTPIVLRIWRRQRQRLALPGHCPACGYDMRANPSRCSECGHKPEPATQRI